MINYKELFEPYTSDGHTIESALKYLKREAEKLKIDPDVMDIAINEVFLEIQNGREFPKDKCPCGCGIDKAGTALIHHIRKHMMDIDKERDAVQEKMLRDRYTAMFNKHLSDIEKRKKKPISERSPTLRGIRKLCRLITSR